MGKVKLGSVCTIVSGSTPKSSCPEYWGGSIKWVTPAEISDEAHYIEDTERRITEEGMRSCHLRMMPLGTVLLSSRAPIGKTAITKSPMCCNQGFKNLICSSSISNEYLYHFLNAKTDELKSIGRGATFKEISKKQVESITIDLPALDEQDRRITVLNQIESLLKRSHDSKNRIDDLVKSRFVEMFEGTVFSKAKLPDMVWFQEGPGVRNYQYTSSGVKLLNVANLHDGKLDLSNTNRFISKEEAYGRYKHFLVDSGDLIIASSGIKVEYFDKKIGFASKEHLPLCMNTSTIRFKVLDESALDIIYFEHFLKSTSFKRQLERQITGSAQLNFGPSHLKKMWVDVPPLALQQELAAFVSQVDKLRFEACYAMYLLCAAFTLL